MTPRIKASICVKVAYDDRVEYHVARERDNLEAERSIHERACEYLEGTPCTIVCTEYLCSDGVWRAE